MRQYINQTLLGKAMVTNNLQTLVASNKKRLISHSYYIYFKSQLWFFKVCFLHSGIQAERSASTRSYYSHGRKKRAKDLTQTLEPLKLLLSTGQLNCSDFTGHSQWGFRSVISEVRRIPLY